MNLHMVIIHSHRKKIPDKPENEGKCCSFSTCCSFGFLLRCSGELAPDTLDDAGPSFSTAIWEMPFNKTIISINYGIETQNLQELICFQLTTYLLHNPTT